MTYLEYCHHCVSHVDSLCVRLGAVCRTDDDPRKMRYQENRLRRCDCDKNRHRTALGKIGIDGVESNLGSAIYTLICVINAIFILFADDLDELRLKLRFLSAKPANADKTERYACHALAIIAVLITYIICLK